MAQRYSLMDDEPLLQKSYHRALQRTGFDRVRAAEIWPVYSSATVRGRVVTG